MTRQPRKRKPLKIAAEAIPDGIETAQPPIAVAVAEEPQPKPKPARRLPTIPLIPIGDFLASDVIHMIKEQPGLTITRGIVRQCGYVIPHDLMGNADAIIQFLREEYTLRMEDEKKKEEALAKRPATIPLTLEIDVSKDGYIALTVVERQYITFNIPFDVIESSVRHNDYFYVDEYVKQNAEMIRRERFGAVHKREEVSRTIGKEEITGKTFLRASKISTETLAELRKQYEIK